MKRLRNQAAYATQKAEKKDATNKMLCTEIDNLRSQSSMDQLRIKQLEEPTKTLGDCSACLGGLLKKWGGTIYRLPQQVDEEAMPREIEVKREAIAGLGGEGRGGEGEFVVQGDGEIDGEVQGREQQHGDRVQKEDSRCSEGEREDSEAVSACYALCPREGQGKCSWSSIVFS